jgi:hypothetical protein
LHCDALSGIFAFFNSGLFTISFFDNVIFVAALVEPAQIHALKHLRPILSFRATRTRMN